MFLYIQASDTPAVVNGELWCLYSGLDIAGISFCVDNAKSHPNLQGIYIELIMICLTQLAQSL